MLAVEDPPADVVDERAVDADKRVRGDGGSRVGGGGARLLRDQGGERVGALGGEQAARLQHEPAEGGEHALPRRPVAHGGEQLALERLQPAVDEVLLRWEVLEDGRDGDVSRLGDLRDAHVLEARGAEEIEVTEVPVEQRGPLLEVYAERYGKMRTVGTMLRALPDPADHPMFRGVGSRAARSAAGAGAATRR